MEEKQKTTLTQGSVAKGMLLFALPIFVSNLFQQLYNAADSLIVGNFLGGEALAAVGSSGSLIVLLTGFVNGVSLGAGAIVLLAALPALSALVRGIASLSAMSGLDDSFMQQLLKIAGLSLLLDFAAQTCRDAQEEALALKVEFAGRVLLLSSALPVLQALLSQLVSLPLS